jgi:hypothetical protein
MIDLRRMRAGGQADADRLPIDPRKEFVTYSNPSRTNRPLEKSSQNKLKEAVAKRRTL